MTNYFSYLLEASMILLILYGFYFLFLRLKASPRFNRFFLLFSLLFSLALPFISIPTLYFPGGSNATTFLPITEYWNFLPELVITGTSGAGEEEPFTMNWIELAKYVYFIGAMVCLMFTIRKISKLWKLIKSFDFTEKGEGGLYKIAHTNGAFPTFSFLHFIFLDNTAPLNESEKQQILQHEIAHVRQKHTLDLLLLEFIRALLWCNPLLWVYRKTLMQVHEHLADRYAVERTEKSSYLKLMVKQTLQQANIPLASLFLQHNTLNRIHMLQSKPSNTLPKALMGASIIGFIFFVVSCDEEVSTLPDKVAKESSPTDFSMQIETVYDQNNISPLPGVNTLVWENEVYIQSGPYSHRISNFKNKKVFQRTADYGISLIGKEKEGEEILQELIERENGKVNSLTRYADISATSKSDEKVKEVVDEMPMPKGGMETLYKTIGENLKYPEEAVSKGIEGRVYIQFVVEKDGSITEVKTVKGLGNELDLAAEKAALATSGLWIPGKNNGESVRTRMILPIVFRL